MDGTDSDPNQEPLSYIRPLGYMTSSQCGYCRKNVNDDGSPKMRYSYYASTKSITPALYQHLVDRCWRRSGTLLYRPNQRRSCCPHYTVRLDATLFHASKDQRQTVNRFNRYIIGDAYAKEAARSRPLSRQEAKRRDTTFDIGERIREAEFNNLPPLKAHRKRPSDRSHKEQPDDADQTQRAEAAEAAEAADAADQFIEAAHRFEVTLEPDTFTEEKYTIFENYQRLVHKEPPSKISRSGFTDFLCNSPLRCETVVDQNGRQKRLGSFHQCYRLDGRLVAVGVLDLLPHCVSAVYFMHHESVLSHNPGKLSAIREIALAVEGGYGWWYGGYYIHSCPKMRYKIDFSPQFVLDPETLRWDRLDKEMLSLLDRKAYVSLSRERQRANRSSCPDDDASVPDDHPVDGIEPSDDALFYPLFKSSMPSLPSHDEVANYDLDDIMVAIRQVPRPIPVKFLTIWDEGDAFDGTTLKSKVAELVAMMGADLIPQLCVDLKG